MMDAKDILAAARISAVRRHPYLASALFGLRPYPCPGIGTCAVDAGLRMPYNPEFIESIGVGPTQTALVHEVMHVLRRHLRRIGARDPQRWNVAADCEINDDMPQNGWMWPKGGDFKPCLPSNWNMDDGLTAEEYYALLPQDIGNTCGKPGMPGAGGQCGGVSGNKSQGENTDNAQDGASGDEEGKASAQGDAPDPVPAGEQEVIRRHVAEAIRQASKSRGTVPGAWVEWAEQELTPPTIPWQRELASAVRVAVSDVAGAVDYSYRKPSRRLGAMRGIWGSRAPIMPSLRQPIPRIAVVVDESGSMGDRLEKALAEVIGIVNAVGCPVLTYGCDSQVQSKVRVSSKRDLKKIGNSMGGTDMRVGFAKAQEDGADIVIILTDGETPWPSACEMGKTRLIACVIGNAHCELERGRVIRVKD